MLALRLCLTAVLASAQQVNVAPRPKPPAARENTPRSNIRVDTNVVLIGATVTDMLNRSVTGLDKEDFRIYEDKVEQKVVHFGSEDAPLSAGIVFDTSASMGPKLNKSRQAVAQFIKTANPEDEFFLVQFSDRAELAQGFTRNLEEIQNKLAFKQAKGRTALLDAVYLALDTAKNARQGNRKVLLIISDGGDNSSRYTEAEIRNLVRESEVLIYGIGIYEIDSARGRTAEELSGPGLLNDIAEQTGGSHFPVGNLNELPDIAAKIGAELRNQYVLGYTPTNQQRDGKYRRVQVKLAQRPGLPPLRVFARQGYYAPSQ